MRTIISLKYLKNSHYQPYIGIQSNMHEKSIYENFIYKK